MGCKRIIKSLYQNKKSLSVTGRFSSVCVDSPLKYSEFIFLTFFWGMFFMNSIQMFQVFPKVPEKLAFLEKLLRNLWWSWRIDAVELFRRINPRLWEKSGHNPMLFLTLLSQKRLEELSCDEGYLGHLNRVERLFDRQVLSEISESDSFNIYKNSIAYFSMEFGIHESLPLFAGGLGVLAGDHLKAASDLKLPMVGVGLLYRFGYFHQILNHDGWQQEAYPETDIFHIPVVRAKDSSGKEIRFVIKGANEDINVVVWEVKVGRIKLYLLDTNLAGNSEKVRQITARLYQASSEIRLAQEILLGIGGMRALALLGIFPSVCHMNEGHCSFLSIERIAQIMEKYSVDCGTAKEIVRCSNVFTTHTPVAAGHDEFTKDLVLPYLKNFEKRLDVSAEEIFSWGVVAGSEHDNLLSMFVLGIKIAKECNGVSMLHGKVARKMWAFIWPDLPEEEVPIGYITNGVHMTSWVSIENAILFERYLGPDWYAKSSDLKVINCIDQIYDEELWRARDMSRSRLVRAYRNIILKNYTKENAPKSLMKQVESVLDPDILTIGFARRFATYKRADLILRDFERFKNMVCSKEYPVQFIFAGKAHPKDDAGKELIRRIVEVSKVPEFKNRIVFIEDYDINIARLLVQGADVWLNTPRRPFEACGTSGIKAAANGVLNVSILDGWWCEGYSDSCGWSIGTEQEYSDNVYQDDVESQALYNVLENDVIPCFYDRDYGDIPLNWIKMMKESIKMALGRFSAHSMVVKYEEKFYSSAQKRFEQFTSNDCKEALEMVKISKRMSMLWGNISIEQPVREAEGPFKVGESFCITSIVSLGKLMPEEVDIELCMGRLKDVDSLSDILAKQMDVKEDLGDGRYMYSCFVDCIFAGRYGFTSRVMPKSELGLRYMPGLITWA